MKRTPSCNDVVEMSEGLCANPSPEELCHLLVGQTWEIIPGRLAFTIHRDEDETRKCIKENPKTYYFSSWMQESYQGFCSDFGPVNLGAVVRFCDFIREKMTDKRLAHRKLVYYCDPDTAFLTNTAFLLGSYLILVERWTPAKACGVFDCIQPSPFRMFRDATHVPSTFDLCLLDCFRGLQRAVDQGWFDYEDFDVHQYELLDDVDNADVHIICPKFLAFRGPRDHPDREEWDTAPEHYVPLFKRLNVSGVVRLNEADTYDAAAMTSRGLQHHDLYFDDCTAPSHKIVEQFHAIADAERGLVAVHCKVGLGRTGTLIATWIMKKHGWSAREAIAWLRIVRPGSVIGPQQHFLEFYELKLRQQCFSAASVLEQPEDDRHHGFVCSAAHSKLLASQISTARRTASASC